MFWKYLLLSCFLLRRYIILIEAKASTELRKTYITNPDAVCNDNSKATFYIGPQSIKKWIVFFESGGLCSSREDCNKRFMNSNSTVLMTSKSLPDEVTGRDLLSTVESENPTFHNYTHVLVPYCSSDLWLGARTNPNKGSFEFVNDSSVDNFGFRGHTIFQSVFSDLLKQYNLSRAEEIILVGSSAGAIGVLNHAEWVLNRVIKSYGLNAKLLTILDSSWFIDFQDGFKSRVQPGFAKLTNITSPACADMSYGYSCCLSSSCMFTRSYFPSTVPVLFVFSLYDIYMFADVLKRLEVEGKTAEDHAADFLSVVSMYGGAMNESLVLVENQAVNMSYFVPACFQHVYFSTSSLWDEILHPLVEVTRGTGKFTHRVQSGTWALTKIHSRSLQDFISSWVKSDFTAGSLVDSCIGAHCNPTCPDKLVFIDSGEVWHKTVKAFVIGLSLVITILCFGLKTSFVFYYNFLLKKRRQYLDDSETSQARKELPLTRRDEAISIACLSLTYLVDIKKEKNHKDITEESEEDASITKPDRNSRTSVILGSAMEEDSGSDYQDFDEDGDVDLIGSEVVNGYTCLDIATEGTNSEPTPQEQRGHDSFISSDGCSTWGSNAGSHVAMIQDSKDCSGSVSCLSPRSKDIESVGKESRALKKQILKGVSAYFNTGELVAIMGPSGCGKTTLLDLLTGRRRHGDCKGQVYINGVGLGRLQEWYACKIGYVLQLAVPYYEELTVRQNLFFAAHLRLAKGTRALEKFERVEQIIAETGLTSLAETVVGGSKGLGLSGGQKRRLCVALQMINMPSVLFLDEPTSGLDATSSLELLNHLNLVAESGRLVILTIHQPRLEIFHLFHKILLLCDGQVAYYGEPSMAPELFLKAYAQATTEEFRLSDKAPKIDAKNPADTIMDLLNCSQARWAILDYYQTSGEPQAVQEAITTAQQKASETLTLCRMEKISRADGAGSFNRIFVLESRAAEKQTLGQILYFPVIFFIFGIIVGTVYWQAEERDGILLMSAYCVYCCASPLFLSSVLMAHLNKALNIFHLEREDGCGRSHENVIQTFVRTTAVCVIPVVVCSTMSYFMVMTSYDVWKFFFVTIISLVLNQTWIAVYMMVICAQPQIAHRICPMVSAIGGFAGGFLVPRPQMPVVYNLLFYINPQFYGYSAITKVLLLNVRLKCEYESTLNCISTDGNAVLSRFGFDKVNPYEHLMIMLGMTVVSLILSWVFLEVKYLNLRQFTRTAPALSAVEAPADDVEVPVKPEHETPAKKIEDEVSEDEFAEIPEGFFLKPFTRNRRSAKSRLGLISKDQGFHTVKIPAQRKRTATAESMFYASQTMTGGEDVEDEARPRSRRLTSATRRELWKSTKQHQKERKISFNMHMTQVQHLARRFSVHHSQSVRRRARKTGASIPRRSTMATTELTDVKRQQFAARKRVVSISDDDCKLDLFSEEVEESPNGNTGEELETSALSQDQLKKDEYNEQTGDICEDLTDGGRATVAEESKRSSGGLIMKHPKDEQKQSKDGCTSGISPELAEKDNGKMERDLPSQNTAEQSVFVSSDLEHSTSQEMEHSTGVLKEDQAERSFCEIENNVLEQGTDNEPLPVSNDSTSQGITLQQTEEQTEKKEEPKRRVSTVAFSDLTDIVDV